MYQSATHQTAGGLIVAAEGPDWDAGECVDVVVRLVCRATQQVRDARSTFVCTPRSLKPPSAAWEVGLGASDA